MKMFAVLFIPGLLVSAFGDTTYVLQNGLNGYAGCKDAMIDELAPASGGQDSVLRTSCG